MRKYMSTRPKGPDAPPWFMEIAWNPPHPPFDSPVPDHAPYARTLKHMGCAEFQRRNCAPSIAAQITIGEIVANDQNNVRWSISVAHLGSGDYALQSLRRRSTFRTESESSCP